MPGDAQVEHPPHHRRLGLVQPQPVVADLHPPRHAVELRDRVGANFPVLADTGCRNTVYNSVPQSAAEYVGRMKQLGLQWFRIDLLRETSAETTALLDRYSRVLNGRDDGRETWRQLKALNQLGVTRGTLNLL